MTKRASLLALAFTFACGGASGDDADDPIDVSEGGEAEDPIADGSANVPTCRNAEEIAPVADGDAIPAPPDVAAAPPDAEVSATGLASKQLIRGCGTEHPDANTEVTVHYTGWTTDGEMFDSSVTRGRPATFPLSRVIAGWTEGVQLMTVGEKRRFWIPGDLAYGANPRPGAPAGMLVFDVELIGLVQPPATPTTPPDVAGPPPDAARTASGLASRVLEPGTGTQHPTARSRVRVHYTGWTTDGEMFDSSVTRGRASTFPLDGVIPGWTEGVQLMVVGEKRRFWIPEDLAYAGRPGAPQGMLVFDVELIAIE
ncbi:MAG: FKBP-type peptidyl-prolyl cis-trans isomerase [Deltaproteobacteria bacterium]|nr:FKBP-type peptidyl-prolyl cis-trans isomerase [Deltaproteobacteria bacterium]